MLTWSDFRLPFVLALLLSLAGPASPGEDSVPDRDILRDRALLEKTGRETFLYFWEGGCPHSGMAYEANFDWAVKPVTTGGTGFGIAAIPAAVERGWISREAAVRRLDRITLFLRDKTDRTRLRGAFPHWLDGATGATLPFGPRDAGADLVETSFLMQGLLIARSYFDKPSEADLRDRITALWEAVEWDHFADPADGGLYWHWDPDDGFHHGLKIQGYNECLVAYVLAAGSPTHPVDRRSYRFWASSPEYFSRVIGPYVVEAAPPCGGPLFLSHYSFVGLDPRRLSDDKVSLGFFIRNTKQTLSNRDYCLYDAPARNRYTDDFWGLTASQTMTGYSAGDPCNDGGAIAPTAAVSSFPYTPAFSYDVLENLAGPLASLAWGRYGPFDALSRRDNWVSDHYLAIDQLPIACMIENYRSGLLWRLFMADADVRRGLEICGLREPDLPPGFPEAVVPFRRDRGTPVRDAYTIRRHPDSGLYEIPFRTIAAGPVRFTLRRDDGETVLDQTVAATGRSGMFRFSRPPRAAAATDGIVTLEMNGPEGAFSLPVRLR
ncbi:MAG: hypothetical protein LUG50_16115 [Planctomycetaceae bacterium]|nr:hypothetical protein [Planctomycetaceae bacterium]